MKVLFRLVLVVVALGPGLLPAQGEAPLRKGDTFELRIAGVPDADVAQVSASYTVDETGGVNLPHLGKMRAEGMTAAQLQAVIEDAYRTAGIYTRPTITIFVGGGAGARFVNVSGEVASPQRIAFTPDLTLLKAITAAGDFTDYANEAKVRILRGNEVIVVDVKRIKKDPSQDVPLLPGDQIIVPQSWI